MTLLEAANKIIDLARKVRDYYAIELPKRHRHYPLVELGEQSAPPPPEERELKKFLRSLSGDMIYQLLLIMYLGRGEFGVDYLGDYYDVLKGACGNPKQAAFLMTDQAPLADYLSDGLEELRKNRIDVEKMPFRKAKVRKA
jgi:Protein of unknown function (DUF3775)